MCIRDRTVRALMDIKNGEQLFVKYDGYTDGKPLAARRKRYWQWFDTDCQCTLCMREEAEEKERLAAAGKCTCGCGGCKGQSEEGPQWDMQAKPVFPEDESTVRKLWTYY